MTRYQHFLNNKRHWLIVLSWLILALLCIIYLTNAGKPFTIGSINDPTIESTIVKNTIKDKLPYGGSSLFILYSSDKLTTDSPKFSSQVHKSLSGLDDLNFKHRISSPYQNSNQISSDKNEAYAVVKTTLTAEQIANSMDHVKESLGDPKNLTLLIGGQPSYIADVFEISESNLIKGELIALPICFIIMIFVFSGIIPALITILSGIISIVIIITLLYMIGTQIELTVFVLNIATMLGLGLSLDYSLLFTYRFREELFKHHSCKATIKVALATAGKSIFFSGLIVFISIASLLFFPINVLFSIGVVGTLVVIITVSCSLTFLPAILCLLEHRIKETIPQLKRISSEDIHSRRWYNFSIMVMNHPFTFITISISLLLALGYPFLNVKLSSSDAKSLPTWTESRIVIDEFDKNFNINELTPIYILLTSKNKSILTNANISAIYDYTELLRKDKRIDKINSIVTINPDLSKKQYQKIYSHPEKLPFDDYQKQIFKESTKNRYTIISVISKYSKDDKRNFELVNDIKNDTIKNGIIKQVGGRSAETIDSLNIVYKLFFKMMIIINIITYIALVWLLRSIILPLKAILMNFFSLSVCYGMLVFIFQEGHFSGLLNFEPLGYTDLNLPILIFFSLFGFSMDYEIFLLTRIKEYYDKTKNNTLSVALGLEKSARIISSAALIVVIVCSAFVTADIIIIKAFGLGTALAIAIDSTVIRLLLVPATMRLLGDWNWYLPKWLDRILPDVAFENNSSCKGCNGQDEK